MSFDPSPPQGPFAQGPARFVLAAVEADGGAMMDEGPSVLLFVGAVVAMSIVAAVVVPPLLARVPLMRAVPALAVVGPLLALAGSLIGVGAMTLSGHDIWYSLLVAGCTGAASIVVGLRLARPVARDLGRVVGTIDRVAAGERGARTGIERSDEIGGLAAAIDDLSRSLARAEAERQAAETERQAVVGALSHDLRTPLASLLVSVEALQDGVGDAGAHLRAMRGNVLALESLVEDLFLLARADAGSLALELEPVDLAELIDEAVEAVGPVASARDVAVTAGGLGPLPVVADDRALGRVLRNLLDNAIRHSPREGMVHVVESRVDGLVRIEIEDEGPGFPPSFLPQAFERFTQADGARSRPGGAGLGLAIARTLLAAHDGRIGAEPGPGGLVWLELPDGRTEQSDRESSGAAPKVAARSSAAAFPPVARTTRSVLRSDRQ